MCCLRLKRLVQLAGMMYVFMLLGFTYPSFIQGGIWGRAGEGGNLEADAAIQGTHAFVSKESGDMAGENTGGGGQNPDTAPKDSQETKPKIALTFDDGPNPTWTPKLLDGLKERDVKATFFLIGMNIEQEGGSEIVKRLYEEGHLIGNHTYHHVEITKLKDSQAYQELAMTNSLIEGITGEKVEFMRPPFGAFQKELAEKIQLLPVMWSVDPLDWATENVDEIVNKVVTETEENDIILLHDCYGSSVKAALRIVDLLKAEGYEFVTVDELLLD